MSFSYKLPAVMKRKLGIKMAAQIIKPSGAAAPVMTAAPGVNFVKPVQL